MNHSIYQNDVDDYYQTPTCRISLRTALAMCCTDYDRGRVIADYVAYKVGVAVDEAIKKERESMIHKDERISSCVGEEHLSDFPADFEKEKNNAKPETE